MYIILNSFVRFVSINALNTMKKNMKILFLSLSLSQFQINIIVQHHHHHHQQQEPYNYNNKSTIFEMSNNKNLKKTKKTRI